MMKASFSSLERYTKTLEIDEESLDSINTEIFGLIEKRFLIGLVTHKVLELIFKEYNGHEINTLSIKNQDMYEYVTEILGKCISESESKYFEIRKTIRKYVRNAKLMLLNNCRNFEIFSVEKFYQYRLSSEVELIAKPDIILFSEQFGIRIVDWKTQSIANTRTDNEQLSIYKMVLEDNFPNTRVTTFSAYLSLGSWSETWHSEDYQRKILESIMNGI